MRMPDLIVTGKLKPSDHLAILIAAIRVGRALRPYVPGITDELDVFSAVFHGLTIQESHDLPKGLGAFTDPQGVISAIPGQLNSQLLIHELGHVIDVWLPYDVRPSTMLYRDGVKDEDGRLVTGPLGRLYNRNCGLRSPFNGYKSDDWRVGYQIHPRLMDEAKDIISPANEDAADIWLNWIRDSFVDNKAGHALYKWETDGLSIWIPILLGRK